MELVEQFSSWPRTWKKNVATISLRCTLCLGQISKSWHANMLNTMHQPSHGCYCGCRLLFSYNTFKTSCPPCRRLKEQKNLNSFFAVMFGLSNSAVHRLYKTWEVRTATFTMIFNVAWNATLVMTRETTCLSSVTENPQQDKKSLLCIRETDGKCAVLDTFKDGSYFLLLILMKRHSVVSLFSAPVRIPHGTTGPTDWLWPNSVRPTSPSCRCCSKVGRLWSVRRECPDH